MAILFDPDAFSDIPRHHLERLMRKIDWLWVNRTIIRHHPLSETLSGFSNGA